MTQIIKKEAAFDDHWGNGWPEISVVEQGLSDPEKLAQLFAGFIASVFPLPNHNIERSGEILLFL